MRQHLDEFFLTLAILRTPISSMTKNLVLGSVLWGHLERAESFAPAGLGCSRTKGQGSALYNERFDNIRRCGK
jgi:hypothetical protein